MEFSRAMPSFARVSMRPPGACAGAPCRLVAFLSQHIVPPVRAWKFCGPRCSPISHQSGNRSRGSGFGTTFLLSPLFFFFCFFLSLFVLGIPEVIRLEWSVLLTSHLRRASCKGAGLRSPLTHTFRIILASMGKQWPHQCHVKCQLSFHHGP